MLLRFIGKNSTNIRVAYKEKLEKLHEEPMGNMEQEYEDMKKRKQIEKEMGRLRKQGCGVEAEKERKSYKDERRWKGEG